MFSERIDKSLTDLPKREAKNLINAIRNEKKNEITIDTAKIHKIISNCFKNVNFNKWENPEEMNRFLDTYELTKLSKSDIKTLNNLKKGNKVIITNE